METDDGNELWEGHTERNDMVEHSDTEQRGASPKVPNKERTLR